MVVDNLVSNAVKYTESGRIVISVSLVDGVKAGDKFVEISVSDTGHGISAEALPHIFERYYQEHGEHQASGTGIGLSLLKSMVELHEGTISVKSKPGVGSVFTVRIDANKTYDNGQPLHVLKGIDLDIEKGEFVSIMGASGSGKSTLLNILGILDNYDSGEYLLNGTLIKNLSETRAAEYRNRMIGFIFQSFNLRLGLKDWAGHYPNEMSGGQKQRVAIARALITHPQIILADEPTGALDSKTSVEVMKLLKQLNEQEGMTIVVVTHESGVANETNKIVHIRDGVIGNIEENFDHHASPFGSGFMK